MCKVKVCSKCKKELPKTLEYFYARKANKDGFGGQCKKCLGDKYTIKTYVNIGMKICNDCGKELNTITFSKNKNTKDGLSVYCKKCTSKQKKEYYKANSDKVKNDSSKYYKMNTEHCEQYRKMYKEQNTQYSRTYNKKYCKENRERLLKEHKKYYKENLDKRLEYGHKHYEENKSKVLKSNKQWRKNNKDKSIIINQNRRARMNLLVSTLTELQWKQTKDFFNQCCCYCGKKLPLAQEHFISVAKGGNYSENNIVPACKSCNSYKSTKDFKKWYKSFKFYTEEREETILRFIKLQQNKITNEAS